MIALHELAAELSALRVDAETDDAVLRRVFDSLAAVEIGRNVSDVAPLAAGDDPASLVRFATAAARATETDDIHVASCATIGAVVVPAAVLAARGRGELVAGVAAGYEAMSRLALAIDGARIVYGNAWTSLICAPVGAAAAASRALGLDADATASALALAGSRAVVRSPEAGAGLSPRWWAIGAAAADGWLAAYAARAGVRARPELHVPVAVDPERLAAPAPRPAVLEVDTKAFPSARQTLPTVQAAIEAGAGLGPDEIESVAAGVPAQVLGMVDRTGSPVDRLDSIVDLRYQVALALDGRDALFDAIREPVVAPPALAQRVTVAADDELTAAFPALGGRVVLRTRTGGTAAATVRNPFGSPADPFAWDDLHAKWRRIARAGSLDGSRLEALGAAAIAADPDALRVLLVDAP